MSLIKNVHVSDLPGYVRNFVKNMHSGLSDEYRLAHIDVDFEDFIDQIFSQKLEEEMIDNKIIPGTFILFREANMYRLYDTERFVSPVFETPNFREAVSAKVWWHFYGHAASLKAMQGRNYRSPYTGTIGPR